MNSSLLNANSKAIRFIVLLTAILAGLMLYQLLGRVGEQEPFQQAENMSVLVEDLTPENSVLLSMEQQEKKGAESVELASPIRIAWQEGQTLAEATKQAAQRSSDWQSQWQGKQEMALLIELGGIANQGAEGLNWQFDLNGKYGERGAGQTTLKAGDHALWRLAPYE